MCHGSSEYDPEYTDEEIAELEKFAEESYEAEWEEYLEDEITALESVYQEEPEQEHNLQEEPEDKQSVGIMLQLYPVPCTGGGHSKRINGVILTDDERLISGGEDGTIKLWNLDGVGISIPSEPGCAVRGIVANTADRILYWDRKNRVYAWEQTWETSQQLFRQKRRVDGVLILSDTAIAVWCDDGAIYIRDAFGALRETLLGHTGRVHGIKELTDGRILSWGADGTLRIWTSDGENTDVFYGHLAIKATLTPDGRIVSMDARQHVIVRDQSGIVERSFTVGREAPPEDTEIHNAVEFMQQPPKTLRNENDGSYFEWNTPGVIRHWSARHNQLMIFGVLEDGPIEVVGDFTVRTIGGREGTYTKNTGASYSPSAFVRWRDPLERRSSVVQYLSPQRKARKVARQLHRRFSALEASGQNIHVTIRSEWGKEVLEALNKDVLARITGVQCTSAQVLYTLSAILPELQLDILQLSFLRGTDSLKNLYAIQAKRLVVYECSELRSIQGTNCLIPEVAVLGCPLLQLDFSGVYVTGPGGEAEIIDLGDQAIEESIPF